MRKPQDYQVKAPGDLAEVDTQYVTLERGKTMYLFGAVDYFTRKRMVGMASRLGSAQGAAFLRRMVGEFPFVMQAIQTDGEGEFLGEFRDTVREVELTHYFNRPNYPQGNGRVERAFRTDEEEFYQVEELPAPPKTGARSCLVSLEPDV